MTLPEGSAVLGPPPAQSKQRYYRPELDVVRLVAFFAVFLYHDVRHEPGAFAPGFRWANQVAAFSNACAFGMALFFALSAYLICELLLREKDRSQTIALKSFYTRRALRIWPLYFLGIGIGCVIALHTHHHEDLALFASFVLMVGNWFLIFAHSTSSQMIVLWSISVEEQFYLFCPLAVRLFSRRGLYILSLVLLVVSNAFLFFLGNRHVDTNLDISTNSFVEFEFFAVGMLLSLVLKGRTPRISTFYRLLMLAAAATLWFIACYVFHARQIPPAVSGLDEVVGYGLAAVGCALIILGFLGISRSLLPAWAIFLGKISFGLYVFHVLAISLVSDLPATLMSKGPIAFVVRTGAKICLTVLLAFLSYRFLETPFLRLKEHFEVVKSRPV